MTDEPSETNDARLTVDAICAVLAHHRRRELVRSLSVDDPVTVTGAATALTEAEDAVERTAIELHHLHIPKLAAHDVVDYDRGRDRLVLTERAAQLWPYLELESEYSEEE